MKNVKKIVACAFALMLVVTFMPATKVLAETPAEEQPPVAAPDNETATDGNAAQPGTTNDQGGKKETTADPKTGNENTVANTTDGNPAAVPKKEESKEQKKKVEFTITLENEPVKEVNNIVLTVVPLLDDKTTDQKATQTTVNVFRPEKKGNPWKAVAEVTIVNQDGKKVPGYRISPYHSRIFTLDEKNSKIDITSGKATVKLHVNNAKVFKPTIIFKDGIKDGIKDELVKLGGYGIMFQVIPYDKEGLDLTPLEFKSLNIEMGWDPDRLQSIGNLLKNGKLDGSIRYEPDTYIWMIPTGGISTDELNAKEEKATKEFLSKYDVKITSPLNENGEMTLTVSKKAQEPPKKTPGKTTPANPANPANPVKTVEKKTVKGVKGGKNTPNTGDNSPLLPLAGLAIVAAGALVVARKHA